MKLHEYIETILSEPADKDLLIQELHRDFDIDFTILSQDEIEQLRGVK